MTTPVYKITIIPEYGYTSLQVLTSLLKVDGYLDGKSSFCEQDLIISNFAVSHFSDQPYFIQRHIEKIQGLVSSKKINTNTSLLDPIKKIHNTFFPPSSNELPVKIIAEVKDAEDKDAEDFIIISSEKKEALSSTSLNCEENNINSIYTCAPPAKFTEEELKHVIDSFHPYTLTKEDEVLVIQAEKNENAIKMSQKKIISSLGSALFEDYLPLAIEWFKTKLIESLKDASLIARLSSFTDGQTETQNKESKSSGSQNVTLLQRALFKQAQKCLEGVQEILQSVLTNEHDRSEFPFIVYKFVPENILHDMSSESKDLLNFIFQFYLPSILKTSITSLQSILSDPTQQTNLGRYLEAFLTNFGADLKVDTIELVAYVIQHNIAAPVEKGAEELIKKTQEKHLNIKLTELLNNVLLDMFFVQPGPVNENIKKILVSVITSLHEFLTLLNNVKANCKSDKTNDIAEMIYQHLCSTGKINHQHKTDSIDLLDLNIRYQVEELLWIILFPKKNIDPIKATLSMKITVIILSTYLQKIISSLFTSDYLFILLEKLINNPISIDNPFEYNLPSEKIFRSVDAVFSEAVNCQIKGILSQILKFGSSNGLFQNVTEKLIELMPDVGDSIQKKLNKAFNSPAPMTPILLVTQLAYQVSEQKLCETKKIMVNVESLLFAQHRFFKALKKPREPSFTSIKGESLEAIKKRQEKINLIFGVSSKILEEKVAQFAPFGTQSFVITTINKLFAIGKNDLILKEILFFLLNGLKAGLKQ